MLSRNHIFVICSAALLVFFSQASFAKSWKLNSDLSCEARDAVIDRMASGSKVRVNASQVAVGEKFSISWWRGRFPEREPIYLMISFDQPVRFKGKALYGLLPDATAGFEISWEQNNTRAVIPFYGRGVPKSGELFIEPIQSGDIGIKWAVVGYNGCNERIDTPNQNGQTVLVDTSGKPEIVVNDPDDFGEPKVTYVNNSGTRHLQIFDGRFRLLDAATGAEILDEVGIDPHFSPAGRYVVIPEGSTGGIYDSVDGVRMGAANDGYSHTSSWHSIVWSHNDSFLLQLLDGSGASNFVNLPIYSSIGGTGNGCRICLGSSGNYRIDMENNSFLAKIYNEFNITKISGGSVISQFQPDILSGEKVTKLIRTETLQNATTLQALIPYDLPKNLIYSDEIKMTNLVEHYVPEDTEEEHARKRRGIAKFLVSPQILGSAVGEGRSEKKSATRPSIRLHWRSLKIETKNKTKSKNLPTKRLVEFGLGSKYPIPSRWIEKFDDFPTFSSKVSYEDYERSLKKISLQFWKQIADSTGFQKNRFDFENQCGAGQNRVVGNFSRVWNWTHEETVFWLTNYECAAGSAAFNNPTTLLFSMKYQNGAASYQTSWGETKFGFDLNNPDNDIGPSCASRLDNCGFEIKVFGKLLLMYSAEARGYAIVDTDTGKLITKQFDLPRGDLFNDILLADDGKHTVSLQEDGSFFVNRLNDAKTVLSGRYADDEVIVWTEDGRYDATAEGAHFVSYKFPGHFGEYTAQQFEGFLKVPGLAKKVMNGEYTPSPVTITPPPVLRAAVNLDDGSVDLEADAKAFVPVKNLSVFQDGLLTDTLNANGTGLRASWKRKIDLLPGTKWISLVAIDDNGAASAPYGLEIAKPAERRNVHIFSTGVNIYDHSKDDAIYNLGAAVADAKLFTTSLSKLTSDKMVIASQTELLEHDASPERILKELEGVVSKAKLGDTIAFYFAGHGVQGKDDKFYLATSNTDVNDIEGTALAFDEVASVLKQSKARIVMFLDACHSGVAGQGLFSTNDDVVENVLQQVPSGVVVFSAAKGREYALEDEFADNGFFARAVADVIDVDRSKHDANNNGSIELSELFRGVKGLVVNRVKAAQEGTPEEELLTQTPWMARNRMVGDFALF